jgi:hypothetical protein
MNLLLSAFFCSDNILLMRRARVSFVAQNNALESFLRPGSEPFRLEGFSARPKKLILLGSRIGRWLVLLAIIATAMDAEVYLGTRAYKLVANGETFSLFTILLRECELIPINCFPHFARQAISHFIWYPMQNTFYFASGCIGHYPYVGASGHYYLYCGTSSHQTYAAIGDSPLRQLFPLYGLHDPVLWCSPFWPLRRDQVGFR